MEGVLDGAKDRCGVEPWGVASRESESGNNLLSMHAELFLRRQQFAEAESLLQEAFRLRPNDPDIMNKLGSAFWELGRPTEAEPCSAMHMSSGPTMRRS